MRLREVGLQLGFRTDPRQHPHKRKEEQPLQLLPCLLGSDPHGARTHDPNIKSVVLYQLS